VVLTYLVSNGTPPPLGESATLLRQTGILWFSPTWYRTPPPLPPSITSQPCKRFWLNRQTWQSFSLSTTQLEIGGLAV